MRIECSQDLIEYMHAFIYLFTTGRNVCSSTCKHAECRLPSASVGSRYRSPRRAATASQVIVAAVG